MPSKLRQKSCRVCADYKRKCDRQVPECQRCIDRDIDCVYPKPPRRRRIQPQTPTLFDHSHSLPFFAADSDDRNHMNDCLGVGASENPDGFDLDAILTEELEQPLDHVPFSFSDLSAQQTLDTAPLHKNGLSGPLSQAPAWFLQDDTWRLSHLCQSPDPTCASFVDLEPLIGVVEQQLRSWVEVGCNSFKHHRLYDDGMPDFLQDAFTTAIAYLTGTSAVKRTVLRIAGERCSKLLQKQTFNSELSFNHILDQTAHVHALFVYMYICLFDGSVWTRSSAEKQIPALRGQLARLLEAARLYRGDDILTQHLASWNNIQPETEYKACQEMWRLWTLIESVRRSHLVIEMNLNTFEAMSRGWAECSGSAMLTIRKGLWEAESSVKWFKLSCDISPLLIPPLDPESVISSYKSNEMDDFVKMLWKFVVWS